MGPRRGVRGRGLCGAASNEKDPRPPLRAARVSRRSAGHPLRSVGLNQLLGRGWCVTKLATGICRAVLANPRRWQRACVGALLRGFALASAADQHEPVLLQHQRAIRASGRLRRQHDPEYGRLRHLAPACGRVDPLQEQRGADLQLADATAWSAGGSPDFRGATNPPFWSPTPTQASLASICQTVGAILYFDTPSLLWKCLAPGTAGQVLQTGGASGNPSWLTLSAQAPLSYSNGQFSTTTGTLTSSNDTNITIALGGAPTNALFNPVSLTMGWAGTLSVARGGPGAGTPAAAFANLVQPPGASTLGGVNSLTCSSHNWFNSLSTGGVFGCSQPSFSDLSSSLACSQTPPLTGDVTTAAGSCATTIASNAVTNAKLTQMGANTIKGNNTGSSAVPSDLTTAQVQKMLAIRTLPGGRITLQSNTPFQTADQTAVTSVFYSPCAGYVASCGPATIPLIDSSGNLTEVPFQQLTLALNTSQHLSGNIYPAYIASNSGVATLCTGPAFSNSTAGSSTQSAAGTYGLDGLGYGLQVNTNASAMTCSFGGSTLSCPQYQCTAVGLVIMTANGQTSAQIHPAAASTGSNSIIGYCNIYNRVRIIAKESDSTSTWTYASATTRNANNSANNRIRWLDCLGTVQAHGTYGTSFAPTFIGTSSPGGAATVGLGYNLDCTVNSNFSGGGGAGSFLGQGASDKNTIGSQVIGTYSPYPTLGLNYIQACEQTVGASGTFTSITFFGNDFMQLLLDYEM